MERFWLFVFGEIPSLPRVIFSFAAAAVAIWAWVGLIRSASGDVAILADMSLDPGFAIQLYVSLAVVCSTLFVWLSWPWIDRLRPSGRFRALEPLLVEALYAIEDDSTSPRQRLGVETQALLRVVMFKLDKLQVPHPPFSLSGDYWVSMLTRLAAAARVADIRAARGYWAAIEPGEDR